MLSLVVLNCLAVGETTGVCLVANVTSYFTVWLSFAPLVVLPDNSKFWRFLFENVVSHYAVSSPTFPVNMSFLGPVLLHTGRHSGAWLSYRRPHMYLSALPSKRGRSWLIFGRYPIRIPVVTLITLGNDCGFFTAVFPLKFRDIPSYCTTRYFLFHHSWIMLSSVTSTVNNSNPSVLTKGHNVTVGWFACRTCENSTY